jgi:autotransporter family porin
LGDAGSASPAPAVPATLTGAISIDATSTLFAGGGVNPAILPLATGQLVTVNNTGTIDLTNGPAAATDSLTIAGNYAGAGGRLLVQTVLGGDGSPSDRLAISGTGATGSGSTAINVTNLGGPGALTVADGILVVDAINGGTTAADAFSLGNIVAAGPFEYLLFRGGVTPGTENDWFLRNAVSPPPARGSLPR